MIFSILISLIELVRREEAEIRSCLSACSPDRLCFSALVNSDTLNKIR